jgi:hypothetical protein
LIHADALVHIVGRDERARMQRHELRRS